jgi:hypothetical protein
MNELPIRCAFCRATLVGATLLEVLRHRWSHEKSAEVDPIEHAIDAMVPALPLSKLSPDVWTVVL